MYGRDEDEEGRHNSYEGVHKNWMRQDFFANSTTLPSHTQLEGRSASSRTDTGHCFGDILLMSLGLVMVVGFGVVAIVRVARQVSLQLTLHFIELTILFGDHRIQASHLDLELGGLVLVKVRFGTIRFHAARQAEGRALFPLQVDLVGHGPTELGLDMLQLFSQQDDLSLLLFDRRHGLFVLVRENGQLPEELSFVDHAVRHLDRLCHGGFFRPKQIL